MSYQVGLGSCMMSRHTKLSLGTSRTPPERARWSHKVRAPRFGHLAQCAPAHRCAGCAAVRCRDTVWCASDASHNDVRVYIISFSGQIISSKWLVNALIRQDESIHHEPFSLILPPQNTVSDRALTSPCWLSRRCAPDASHDDVPVCILSTSGQIILRKWLPTASMGQGESIRHKSLRLILPPQTAVSDCVPTLACVSDSRSCAAL